MMGRHKSPSAPTVERPSSVPDWLPPNAPLLHIWDALDHERLTELAGRCLARPRPQARVLTYILAGYSDRLACGLMGQTRQAWWELTSSDPELYELSQACHAFSDAPFEAEYYRRAMAGADDKASLGALKGVLGARLPEYRSGTVVNVQVGQPGALRGLGSWRNGVIDGVTAAPNALPQGDSPSD